MELHERIDLIKTKDDLADFVEALKNDLISHPEEWENRTLERFLDAMSAWIKSVEGAYKNLGKEVPVRPSWKIFADILYASKIYE